jgi:polar amino acid transport system substrate-binding protein
MMTPRRRIRSLIVACGGLGFAAMLAILALDLPATAQPAPVAVPSPLALLTEDDLPGLSHSKVTELMHRAKVVYGLEVLPWARAYRRAQTERDTCVYSTTRTPEREALFLWVAPLRTTNWVLVGRRDDPLTRDIRSLAAARGLTIGAYRDDAVAQHLASQGFKLDLVDTNLQNLRKLLAGRIDLWATSSAILRGVATEAEAAGRVQTLAVVREVKVFLACNPGTAVDTLGRLRQAWAQMEADGTVALLDSRFPN